LKEKFEAQKENSSEMIEKNDALEKNYKKIQKDNEVFFFLSFLLFFFFKY